MPRRKAPGPPRARRVPPTRRTLPRPERPVRRERRPLLARPRPAPRRPVARPANLAPHHRPVTLPRFRGRGAAHVRNTAGLTSSEWNARYGNVAANTVKATAVYAQIKMRYPMVSSGGIYNCRKQRGTGSNPNDYSVHSVAGAVDAWPNGGPVQSIIDFAKSIPGVWDAWLDASPGDIHVQIVPNPPSDWVPPCAGGGTKPRPITDPLWDLLHSVGFAENVKVPFEPNGLSALEMAWCIAKSESGGNLSTGGNLFQFVNAPPASPRANAARALAESGMGTVWVAWCTAFGGPRVPPHNAKANCGHKGPNYLKTVGGISPAYVSHIAQLPSRFGGPAGHGGPRPGHHPSTSDVNIAGLSPPRNCAEATSRKVLTLGKTGVGKSGDASAFVISHVGELCNIPVFGQVSCGIAGFLSHLPAYLKIAAGGTIMFGGLALIIAGATGNTSAPSQVASAAIMRTPVGDAVTRRRAIATERGTQRSRAARAEAEERVSLNSRDRVRTERRSVYRARVAAENRAMAAATEAETGESVGRRVTNLRRREAA